MYHIGLGLYLMQTIFMDSKSITSLIIYTSFGNLKTIQFGNSKWRNHYGGYMS